MKTKNSGKKLTLNKKTVADLDILEIKDIYGGMKWTGFVRDDSGCPCPSFTCPSDCSVLCC
jgi:hypothetical protein